MTDIRILKETTAIQFILERFLENYNNAETESDKYMTIYQLLDYIDNSDISIDKLQQYMKLQPDKFKPFLSIILKIEISKTSNETINMRKSNYRKHTSPTKAEVYIFEED